MHFAIFRLKEVRAASAVSITVIGKFLYQPVIRDGFEIELSSDLIMPFLIDHIAVKDQIFYALNVIDQVLSLCFLFFGQAVLIHKFRIIKMKRHDLLCFECITLRIILLIFVEYAEKISAVFFYGRSGSVHFDELAKIIAAEVYRVARPLHDNLDRHAFHVVRHPDLFSKPVGDPVVDYRIVIIIGHKRPFLAFAHAEQISLIGQFELIWTFTNVTPRRIAPAADIIQLE